MSARPRLNYIESPRGYLLCLTKGHVGVVDRPILTVELAHTWYELFLVRLDGSVESVCFSELEPFRSKGGSYFCDHVPNPDAVAVFADAKGYYLDGLAEELIVGRWQMEVVE